MSDMAPPAQQPRLSEGGAPAPQPPQPEVSASVGAVTAAPAWDSAARRYGFLIGAAVTLCLLDQLTKYIITVTIGPTGADPGREIVVVPGFIFLRYIENTGMAFGLFRELGDFFIPIALAIMTAVVFYYRALRGRAFLLRTPWRSRWAAPSATCSTACGWVTSWTSSRCRGSASSIWPIAPSP